MLTLFVNGTLLDDLTIVLGDILVYGGQGYTWVFIVYILLSAFTVLNMLIGVLCEVVTKTAAEEQEAMMIREVQVQLRKVFNEIEPKHLIALNDTLFEEDVVVSPGPPAAEKP